MTLHRKIGGIHWFSIGPYRISFCRLSPEKIAKQKHYQQLCRETELAFLNRPEIKAAHSSRPTVLDLHALSAEPQHLILPNVSAWTWPEGVAHVMNREDA